MPDPPRLFDPSTAIILRGARVHNLRGVDLDIPRDRLVVFTGVSGSGKSSLAFDTIFAEGQRRYLECLSSSARQFLEQLERPDVDLIEGLPPTVAIDQKPGQASPRSTVGTLTDVYDYLRLLFARVGTPHCPACGLPIQRQTPEKMVDLVLGLPPGKKVLILAPLVRGRKGQHAEVFQAIRRAGLIRARVDGEILEVPEEPPKLARTKLHHIEAVVDRLVVREGIRPRLAESVDLALKLSQGLLLVVAETGQGWEDQLLSANLACPGCGAGLQPPEPRSFSFNSPYGACPECQGLGVASTAQADPDEPPVPCPACQGSRLSTEARSVLIHGRSIAEITAEPVAALRPLLDEMTFGPAHAPVATPLLREISGRLRFLEEVGLGYLALARGAETLSGGELQRARLATQLGAGLVGVCYVLDEPTAALHPRDTDRLLQCLRGLQRQGNSVLVVEHDEAVIRAADWVIDLGPGAGPDGGRIVAAGRPSEIAAHAESITGRYLGSRPPPLAARPRAAAEEVQGWIVIRNATVHNLKGIEARIPWGLLTCVTGVSGSGKSTLVSDVLTRGFRRQARARRRGDEPAAETRIEGLDGFTALLEIDQSPIGRSPRSTPATFTGVFDEIRRTFAATRQARQRGYRAARFSFNARGGRCEVCAGQGRRRIPMRFLPDLYLTCEECQGQRFNRQTLEVRFKDRSIGEVLELRADEALRVFDAQPRVLPGLAALHEVGLGYLTLGQSSTTLSGGEAQRIKLAAELSRATGSRNLIILDEPTTGLHFADIDRLMSVLRRLVEQGNTVVVIEHNLDVIAASDWIIDLGPEGGAGGGAVVAMGRPAEIAAVAASRTGSYLKSRLEPATESA